MSEDHTRRYDILPVTVGTDPRSAFESLRGRGYYKVPSLKGVWYRGPFEHNGSVAKLEDWFDPARLREDYVPTGFKGYGVKTRAIKVIRSACNWTNGKGSADCISEDALSFSRLSASGWDDEQIAGHPNSTLRDTEWRKMTHAFVSSRRMAHVSTRTQDTNHRRSTVRTTAELRRESRLSASPKRWRPAPP